ncbi:sigma-54 interaction domain-containing protein [Bacillus sp. 1P02SD]|uniref:sigma-54 interaction domain-containing protein n=1 Tax=Bacillus sp. 1P02SD TaxID=3132264 RepID=UPI0039A01763
MERDFVLLFEEDVIKEKLKKKLTDNRTTFLLKKNHIYYLCSDDSTNQFVLNRSDYVSTTDSIFDLLTVLKQTECVLVKDENGQAIGFVNALLLSKYLINSYQYLHAYFDAVIHTLDASVTVINQNGEVLVWTEGAEDLFSIKKEDIIGKPITQFFDIDMLEIMKTLKEGRTIYRHQHQPRSDLFVLINSQPVYLHNQIVGAVVSETDITSQVRLNQELFNVSTKVHYLEKEVAKLSPSKNPFHAIKGGSPPIKRTIEMVEKISSTDTTVLISGESGVGKELFAKAIHELRESSKAPFIPINCGAIPPTLFESELFGYERGAFSGADNKGKRGKIELARGGTLFLDEIGEMQLEMQVKLLRVLQDKKYFSVGGTKEISADFRVIAATNRDLKEMVKEGKFREDLYYRLNVINLAIPPLRERREDIIELTHYFLYEFSVRYGRPIHGVSQEVMYQLLHYDWPGNIRELRNVIERLVVLATDGTIKKEDLPFTHQSDDLSQQHEMISESIPLDIGYLTDELEKHERKIILDALKLEKGNKQACAKRLGITRATLYNRLKRLQITV